MNNSQKSFLNELAALCKRYGVDSIDIENDHIRVIGKEENLYFKELSSGNEGTFYGVATTRTYYEVTPDTY